jgi:thymidylate synthase
MRQYLDMLQTIKDRGTQKPPAREGMPGSLSLFGYQNRYNLQEGFPILTTKKVYWRGVVTELLWFLRGDTNIKFLVDNGVNIWNEDAYNYYLKKAKENEMNPLPFDTFINYMKLGGNQSPWYEDGYELGDCGFQYGKVWRNWESVNMEDIVKESYSLKLTHPTHVDQIAKVIANLKKAPESRRHIVTAIDPAHDEDLALYWCHALFQFNCRPTTRKERLDLYWKDKTRPGINLTEDIEGELDKAGIPKYYLDCQLYQRSADAVLGVPFNISSYALLIHIIARICNMIPGEFIHTFGDVHIYDNHKEAVEEQLSRTPDILPKLYMNYDLDFEGYGMKLFDKITPSNFELVDYTPQTAIKAELSTGLKK